MKQKKRQDTEHTGFFVVDRETCRVLYLDEGAALMFPDMREGRPCYLSMGRTEQCPDCPMKRLEEQGAVGIYRNELGLNVAAFRLSGSAPRALLFYGGFSLDERQKWMENGRYQTILRQNNIIAFEHDPVTGENFVSPFVSELLAGNYDGRPLSQVMLEDGVLHPGDHARLVAFRESLLAHPGNATVLERLKGAAGGYRWYRMSVSCYQDDALGHAILMGTITDADEEVRLRERFRRQAEYDDLTGIYHRAAFYRMTEELLSREGRTARFIVVFDVDRFKMVNALFGVDEGDKLLQFVGRALGERMREGESYGRLRDDVFVVCAARPEAETLALLADLERAMQTYPLPFHITLTAGLYRLRAKERAPVNVLCDRAALALKSVKDSAITKYAFYVPKLDDAINREQEMTGAVYRGLESGEFTVWLQPKVRLDTGGMIGAEALVRWNRPGAGQVPPDEFIPVLERNGLITVLDKYVWEQVCRTLRRWLDAGLRPPAISINVSRVHLFDPKFGEELIALTRRYGLPASLLELELTESAYVENPHLGEIMERLRTSGFTFAMDDFGSGYSSLNMLRNIPVDVLKIDLHFLSYSWEDEPGKIILKCVVGMARELGIPVVAEGVETAEQAAFLKQVGCTMAQGYLFARPMPIGQFERTYSLDGGTAPGPDARAEAPAGGRH